MALYTSSCCWAITAFVLHTWRLLSTELARGCLQWGILGAKNIKPLQGHDLVHADLHAYMHIWPWAYTRLMHKNTHRHTLPCSQENEHLPCFYHAQIFAQNKHELPRKNCHHLAEVTMIIYFAQKHTESARTGIALQKSLWAYALLMHIHTKAHSKHICMQTINWVSPG